MVESAEWGGQRRCLSRDDIYDFGPRTSGFLQFPRPGLVVFPRGRQEQDLKHVFSEMADSWCHDHPEWPHTFNFSLGDDICQSRRSFPSSRSRLHARNVEACSFVFAALSRGGWCLEPDAGNP